MTFPKFTYKESNDRVTDNLSYYADDETEMEVLYRCYGTYHFPEDSDIIDDDWDGFTCFWFGCLFGELCDTDVEYRMAKSDLQFIILDKNKGLYLPSEGFAYDPASMRAFVISDDYCLFGLGPKDIYHRYLVKLIQAWFEVLYGDQAVSMMWDDIDEFLIRCVPFVANSEDRPYVSLQGLLAMTD